MCVPCTALQVGACIVNDKNIILSIGYNGFPRGCADSALPWSKRAASGSILDTKYPYVREHLRVGRCTHSNKASVLFQMQKFRVGLKLRLCYTAMSGVIHVHVKDCSSVKRSLAYT